MSKVFKVSIIGSGKMAREHANVCKKVKNIELFEVYSRNISNAKNLSKKFNISKYTDNLNKIFQSKIDGVIVCVSADKIYEITKKILKHQVPLLIEKPVGLSLEQIESLNKLNNKFKTPNLVGLNRRYYSNFLEIYPYINSKNFRGFLIEGHEHLYKLRKIIKHKLLKDWLYANSIHTINLIDFFTLGKKYKVNYITNNFKLEKNISIIIKTEDNIIGTYISNWSSKQSWSVKLFFDGFSIIYNPLEKSHIFNEKGKKIFPKISKFDKTFKPGLYNQLLNFISLMTNQKNKWPDENLKTIVKTYRIINKII